MEKTTIKIGDVVRLKSGSLPMTVIENDHSGIATIWMKENGKMATMYHMPECCIIQVSADVLAVLGRV